MLAKNREVTYFSATVLENNTDMSTPDSYLLATADCGTQVKIIYHIEFPPPINFHAGDIGYQLLAGDMIEVFASVVDENVFCTCEDNEFFIRLVA